MPMVPCAPVKGRVVICQALAKLSLSDGRSTSPFSPSRSAGCRPEGPPAATEKVATSVTGVRVGVGVGGAPVGVRVGVDDGVGVQSSVGHGVAVSGGAFTSPIVIEMLVKQI